MGQAKVIDGDTISIAGQEFRLYGIDAPEIDQVCNDRAGKKYSCGQKASFELASWISASPVDCRLTRVDGVRRPIAFCTTRSQDISRWMVANGWALAFRRISVDYVAEEAHARNNDRGIWEGEFISPSAWRKGKR